MERDTLEVDVLIVGGGPAGLSAALRLTQLQAASGAAPMTIALLEKAREAGGHSLSGAVLDPSSLAELVPDFVARGAPVSTRVERDRVFVLTRHHHLRLPVVPSPLRNHGNYLISLNELVNWLATQVEGAGVDLFSGFAGQELLMDGRRVSGVRTGDRGVARSGEHKSTFEPGVDIRAGVTILCDGVRGNLTKALVQALALQPDRHPQQYAIGLKELWEVPEGRVPGGTVMHTLGYPLRHREFGGGFLYGMGQGQVSLGLVVGLDYQDPLFDPHVAFNHFKVHPLIRDLLAGGRLLRYGAKALPEGGWSAMPRLFTDGALIAGDAGGFLNSMRLKGIHLAMKSGMLAAETAFEAIRSGDTSASRLQDYEHRVRSSSIQSELYPVRNVHQAFGYGLVPGLAYAGLSLLTRGKGLGELDGVEGHRQMQTLADYYGRAPVEPASDASTPDRVLTFDKVTNVHYSGTTHEEDQPSHLKVDTNYCTSVCGPQFGHPCIRFCPAHVYEIAREADGSPRLQINASNCVHCKTCDIMDPYGAITWVPPEGGGGPQYKGM
ncbi:MAG: electron transfer flavoprotein-ubiquinone oxidoreductase [Vicinamibacterales bacterium]